MSNIQESLRADVDRAPKEPGCYLFRDGGGTVLYVGKAKVLRNRIRNYLRPQADGRIRIPYMVAQAVSVEFVLTSNEKEALILENNLIKLHKPRYNVALRDDRTYVSVKIDIKHEFPRAKVVHKYKKDGAEYIGPFASSSKLRETLEALKHHFPLRRCTDHVLRNRTRACVYHEIGICCAPCVKGKVEPSEYAKLVNDFKQVLRGKDASVVKSLEVEMAKAAGEQQFERAALLRDRIFAIRSTVQGQSAQIAGTKQINRDVVGLCREGGHVQVHVLLYRDDKLVGSTTHNLESGLPDDELIEQFTMRYYEGERPIPSEVLLPVEIDDAVSLASYISDKAGFAVGVATPQRGDKVALVKLANLNAKHAMRDRDLHQEQVEVTLAKLQEELALENLPRRIECYDISHFQGDEIVGSRVTFIDGKPSKDHYRRYKLKEVTSNDDFASMDEVLTRRLERAVQEEDFPDLIVVDGGPAQLSRVQLVFERLNIVGVDLVGLAKARDKSGPAYTKNYRGDRSGQITRERLYLVGKEAPVVLKQDSQEMYLLMRLRDEAHRFAITYNRERRRKVALTSGLDAIAGVGPKRKRALIKKFGSPAQIKLATLEELRLTPGITDKLARVIVEHFAGQKKEE